MLSNLSVRDPRSDDSPVTMATDNYNHWQIINVICPPAGFMGCPVLSVAFKRVEECMIMYVAYIKYYIIRPQNMYLKSVSHSLEIVQLSH